MCCCSWYFTVDVMITLPKTKMTGLENPAWMKMYFLFQKREFSKVMLAFRGVHPGKLTFCTPPPPPKKKSVFGEDDFPLHIRWFLGPSQSFFRGATTTTGELLLVYCLVFGNLMCIAGHHPTFPYMNDGTLYKYNTNLQSLISLFICSHICFYTIPKIPRKGV